MKLAAGLNARDCTSMRAGGRLTSVYAAETTAELNELLQRFISCRILGGGSNTIIADGEVATPVICLGQGFATVSHAGEILKAGAAISTPRLLRYCAEHGLSGLEGLAGIPGQLGGAICMNAGTGGWGILEAITELELVDQSGRRTIDPADLGYSYRDGQLPHGAVVTAAVFRLKQAEPAQIEAAIRANLNKRSGQPKGFSSGCIFKNPEGDSAGRLIDSCGFKGARVGGA
ncbi:MAG: UDP-N-acetylenolpyruvoylglucosamine reductase [Deltaproteobacteria bacterium ADurb.Bin510]|nr:MAG: UDP-N-acetylenolpyruvoylglucosamine reductase [Deltaproteobacteria bacterium ADurb.Bin510]